MRHSKFRSALCTGAVAGLMVGGAEAAEEKPADIIAAHIQQGYACENALSAQRNRRVSKPNETVWTLRCNNGTYRVRLVPDLAAGVELVKPPKSD